MINREMKCIQIHIPKTGGMSIRRALFKVKGTDRYMHLPPYDKRIKRVWDEFYTFTFVRNPFDRLFSSYSFTMDSNNLEARANKAFISEMRESRVTFEEFVLDWLKSEINIRPLSNPNPKKQIAYKFQRFSSMKNYFIGPNMEEYEYNFIGRFENLQKDYKKLCNELGLYNSRPLPVINKSTNRSKDYTKQYSREMIEIVEEIYAWDLERFNYKFGE